MIRQLDLLLNRNALLKLSKPVENDVDLLGPARELSHFRWRCHNKLLAVWSDVVSARGTAGTQTVDRQWGRFADHEGRLRLDRDGNDLKKAGLRLQEKQLFSIGRPQRRSPAADQILRAC